MKDSNKPEFRFNDNAHTYATLAIAYLFKHSNLIWIHSHVQIS